MKENETNVAPEGTSPEPAKTAENGTIVSSPGAPPAAAIELPKETDVSYPNHHHDVAQIDHLESRIIAIFEQWFDPKLEALKAEILAKVSELVPQVVGKPAEALPRYRADELVIPPIVEAEGQAHELAVGDPVKVWADPNHKTFLLGTIVAVHEGGAYDVETDDGVTKIPADGLEFDDRR